VKFVFVVTRSFGSWMRGDIIRDPKIIAEISKGDNMLRLVRVSVPSAGG
jgi:hypothetical protein